MIINHPDTDEKDREESATRDFLMHVKLTISAPFVLRAPRGSVINPYFE